MKNLANAIGRRVVCFMSRRRWLAPLQVSRLLYRFAIGRWPDLRNPRDLNEKTIWLSHFSDTGRWPMLADKYAVREYVADKAGEDILVPLLQLADTPDDLDFDRLPSKFVIKTTDGFSRILIVKDKDSLDISRTRRALDKWMKERIIGDETHYLKINRRLVAEALLEDKEGNIPKDYKFFCFDGEPLFCLVCSDRDLSTLKSRFSLYRLPVWQDTDGIVDGPGKGGEIAKPENLDRMMQVARQLSKGLKLARIDLYDLDGKIYFGEITLTPAAGRQKKFKQSILDEMGSLINLET